MSLRQLVVNVVGLRRERVGEQTQAICEAEQAQREAAYDLENPRLLRQRVGWVSQVLPAYFVAVCGPVNR
jgi:hypothetical protein